MSRLLFRQRRSVCEVVRDIGRADHGQAAAVLPACPVAAAGVPLITAERAQGKAREPGSHHPGCATRCPLECQRSQDRGAVREDPEAIESWAGKYAKEKTLILYCA